MANLLGIRNYLLFFLSRRIFLGPESRVGSALLAVAGERERRWKGKKNGKEEKVNGLGKSFACAMLTRYLFLWCGIPRVLNIAPGNESGVLGGPCAAEMLSGKGKTDSKDGQDGKKGDKGGEKTWRSLLGSRRAFRTPGMWPMSLSASCNASDRGDHTNR